MMNYQEFIKANVSKKVLLGIQSPLKALPFKKIEKIIQKELPSELLDFYSFCDGLEWQHESQELSSERIPSISEMFGNFKSVKKASKSLYLKDELYKLYENPFWEQIWDDEFCNLGKCDMTTFEGLAHFNFLMNLKPLMFMSGKSENLVIDFYDPEKPYQIYFQDYADIYPLNINFKTFYQIFLQIGITAHWYMAFFDENSKPNWDTNVDFEYISQYFPDFDLSLLGASI